MGKIIKHIGIIGTGNLGTQLALQADQLNYNVKFVFNRTIEKAHALAGTVDAKAIGSLEDIIPTDIIFLSVPDHQIQNVIKDLLPIKEKLQDSILVHCSGATSIQVLNKFQLYGIFYPLQTFTKNKIPNWGHIPIFIEGNTKEVSQTLEMLASSFSKNVFLKTSEERKKIHCGAIFVSNFVHAMANAALQISEEDDFENIYFPLISEAVAKLKENRPKECLTGPAKRKDFSTIENHLEQVKIPKLKQIYQLLTEYIQENML